MPDFLFLYLYLMFLKIGQEEGDPLIGSSQCSVWYKESGVGGKEMSF